MTGIFIQLIFFFIQASKPVPVQHVEVAQPDVIAPALKLQPKAELGLEGMLEIKVKDDGEILVDGDQFDVAGFEALLKQKMIANPDLGVALNADRDLPVEGLKKVLDLLQNTGVAEIVLVARGEE